LIAEDAISMLMEEAVAWADRWAREDSRFTSYESSIFGWDGWIPGENPFYINLVVETDSQTQQELSTLARKGVAQSITNHPEEFMGLVVSFAREGMDFFDVIAGVPDATN
jgi:hypothetical protein